MWSINKPLPHKKKNKPNTITYNDTYKGSVIYLNDTDIRLLVSINWCLRYSGNPVLDSVCDVWNNYEKIWEL